VLGQLLIAHAPGLAGGVDGEGPDAGGPGVDTDDNGLRHRPSVLYDES
jgi:hypothetical protein